MTLQQLKYIIAIDRQRNFAKAAEQCGISQPTLSAMLMKLEEELDVRIFERNNKNVIPTTKLTVILNNFIINTTNHLNKLSTNVDEKLSEFDKKMHDLEIMTSLFEAKLESLPDEIKSTFPPLQPCNLDDVNPTFSASEVNPNINQQQNVENQGQNEENQGQNEENQGQNAENQEQEKIGENAEDNKEEENQELSPEEDLNKFLEEHSELQSLYKMLKFGVPIIGVTQKANSLGCDMDLVNELFDKAKKVNSSIQ